MKKWISVVLGLILVIGLSGCGTVAKKADVKELLKGESYSAGTGLQMDSGLIASAKQHEGMVLSQTYEVECYDKYGNLKWRDVVHNLVPEAGLTKYIDATIKTGLASPAWYVGLVTGPGSGTTFADTDVLATHAGWTEDATSYTGTRPALNVSAAISCTGSGSCSLTNSANKASYTIDSTCSGGCTIAGAFVCSAASGTTGTLLGAGDFSGGDRSVVESDTLNVTITVTLAKS